MPLHPLSASALNLVTDGRHNDGRVNNEGEWGRQQRGTQMQRLVTEPPTQGWPPAPECRLDF